MRVSPWLWFSNASSSLCRWHTSGEKHEGVFSRQALPMVWDFSERNPFSESTSNYGGAVDWVADVVAAWPESRTGLVQQANATEHSLPSQSADIWFTDPPYYFAVPYADLSDFFFVWLKRLMPNHPLLRDPYDSNNPLTPKTLELCEMARWDPVRYQHKNQQFFEDGMTNAFAEGHRILDATGVGSVVFAHKTTEGWEALLTGMVRGGWTITGSWPIATEMEARLRARDSAALATSVHLICRPRPEDAPTGEWADVLENSPFESETGCSACRLKVYGEPTWSSPAKGSALEIYSRYSKVETPEGNQVALPEYLN